MIDKRLVCGCLTHVLQVACDVVWWPCPLIQIAVSISRRSLHDGDLGKAHQYQVSRRCCIE